MSIIEVTSAQHHDQLLKSGRPHIIFFGSERCGYCKQMKPVFSDIAQKSPHILFAHVETTKVPVDELPAVPIFVGHNSKGEVVGQVRGADVKGLQNLVQSV